MFKPRFAAAALAAAVALSLPVSASASEDAGSTLELSWSAPEISLQVFTATLTCSPDTSTGFDHEADVACAEINAAGGNLASLPGWWFMNCATYRGWKIRTTAVGTWQGEPVDFDNLHDNICEARKATGTVFLF